MFNIMFNNEGVCSEKNMLKNLENCWLYTWKYIILMTPWYMLII